MQFNKIITGNCRNVTIDLSTIFNEFGYINPNNCNKYTHRSNITNIILTQSKKSPIKIGDSFLFNYSDLRSIDTSQLINVIAIGNNFLSQCYDLTKINTTGLFSLIEIGNGFCSNCRSLIEFDAKRLNSLITIGKYFLYGCSSLTLFDTSGLISLTTVEYNFIYGCNATLTVIVKKPSNYLYDQIAKTNYVIVQLYDKPILYLGNDCVI